MQLNPAVIRKGIRELGARASPSSSTCPPPWPSSVPTSSSASSIRSSSGRAPGATTSSTPGASSWSRSRPATTGRTTSSGRTSTPRSAWSTPRTWPRARSSPRPGAARLGAEQATDLPRLERPGVPDPLGLGEQLHPPPLHRRRDAGRGSRCQSPPPAMASRRIGGIARSPAAPRSRTPRPCLRPLRCSTRRSPHLPGQMIPESATGSQPYAPADSSSRSRPCKAAPSSSPIRPATPMPPEHQSPAASGAPPVPGEALPALPGSTEEGAAPKKRGNR